MDKQMETAHRPYCDQGMVFQCMYCFHLGKYTATDDTKIFVCFLCILPQVFKSKPPLNFHRLCTVMEPKSFSIYMHFLLRYLTAIPVNGREIQMTKRDEENLKRGGHIVMMAEIAEYSSKAYAFICLSNLCGYSCSVDTHDVCWQISQGYC